LRSARQWQAQTGMTTGHALRILWQALRSDAASVSQTVMAANAPMLLQRSMVEGRPAEGVMSAGQVAALIGRIESCQQVIEGIVDEACRRLAELAALAGAESIHV